MEAGAGAAKGSLTFVGTGLYAAGQITPEAFASIREADRLFHLVVDPVSRHWLEELHPSAESLFEAYAHEKPRRDSYDEMAARVLSPVRQGQNVCAALYGHPGVLVDPSHRAIQQARFEGHSARMLPGVSSEDCLFADLGVDPAARGCQSFEATDFLVRKRAFDPGSGLVLWQIGAIGVTTYRRREPWSRGGLKILSESLQRCYPKGHLVVLYEAARFAIGDPLIQVLPLEDLGRAPVSTSSTLYVPPVGTPASGVSRQERAEGLPRSRAGRGALTIVGTGYRVSGQITQETLAILESADRLFYLVTDPATSAWLTSVNPRAESLHDCYRIGESGPAAVGRMVERILAPLREESEVCAAFSGHPAVGVPVSHEAVRRARTERYPARLLPAISFEDCLFADLGVDPGGDGRLLFDAGDFLRRAPRIDTSSMLLLIQAGAVGVPGYRDGEEPDRTGLARLSEVLGRLYGADHEAVVYEIPDFPMFDPVAERIRISDLSRAPMTIRSTLYVPPLARAERDPAVAERLAAAALA
jgi:diphthamide biosynthesis methyltransferase